MPRVIKIFTLKRIINMNVFRNLKKLLPRRRPSRATSRKARLQMEMLEDRTVMSVLGGAQVTTSGGIAGAFAPPPPAAAGLALINSLPDATVRFAALADYRRDGMITRNDMLDIINLGTNGYNWLTLPGFSSLQTLVTKGPTVGMPDYVRNLALKCLVAASKDLQTAAPNVVASDLGQAVNDFFLGKVHPDASYIGVQNIDGETVIYLTPITPSYQAVNLPLWNKYSGPSYHDVAQGYALNDCWLLAGLAEVAAQNPGDIQSMFIDNGDQTYTVRFYNGSTPDYVTVDNYLPEPPAGDQPYDRPQSYLWAALAEKAYVQENANGWIGSSQPGVDSYQALNDGSATWALAAITGLPANQHDGYSGGDWWSTLGGPSLSATVVANAWSQGEFVILGTYSPASDLVVPGHDYAVVGYSSGIFTLFNPWGTGGRTVNGHYYDAGSIEVDATGLADNFNSWTNAGAAGELAAPPMNSLAGFRPVATSRTGTIAAAAFSPSAAQPTVVPLHQIQPSLQANTSTTIATSPEPAADEAMLNGRCWWWNGRWICRRPGVVQSDSSIDSKVQLHDLAVAKTLDKATA
jgi:hypothetical protein